MVGGAERRIIPAHAGQTCSLRAVCVGLTDHPRACGANLLKIVSYEPHIGSSPRMRGKLTGHAIIHGGRRIIPAHAGQTFPARSNRCPPPDHPRACGANFSTTVVLCVLFGSSPRMRGKRADQPTVLIRFRIIPAHAGQTRRSAELRVRTSDHPRACGANVHNIPSGARGDGSSPRMRGKRADQPTVLIRFRIIPAHAGQTDLPYGRAIESTDHPRACGANQQGRTGAPIGFGSSPRMRGKRIRNTTGWRPVRIIPAHAGQTFCMSNFFSCGPDHPRACGANSPILCENS